MCNKFSLVFIPFHTLLKYMFKLCKMRIVSTINQDCSIFTLAPALRMINQCTVENMMNLLEFMSTFSSSSHPVALAVDFKLRNQEVSVSHYVFSMELI